MSPPPLRALAVALVSALVAIAVTDWLALDLLHHELLDRPLRAYATPSCFAALDLWAPRFWLRLGLEDGLRWGRWLHVCFAIGGLLLCRLALPRPLSRDAARSLTALLLTSALLLLAPVITGAVALREQLYALLTPLGPGRWYTTPGAPTDVFTVARQHVLMSTSLAAVQLTLLSAGAAATAALGLRRRAALDPRDAWALLAASAPALMAFGALAYVQIEFVVNRATAPEGGYERWTAILSAGRWLAITAAAAVSVAAWRASAGRGHPRRASRGGAGLALALGFAGALGFATAPHRDALRQLYRAPDTGLGEHELNDVDALARAELPRIAACPAPSYRDVQPLLLVARHERGSARVVLYAEDDEHVVDDPRALAAWLSNKMLQRTPEEDARYCRQGAPLYPRRSPSQLEVIIAADASLPRAALDPALARVAEAAERVEFGVARAAETVYASERGEVVTRAHCVTQWFTLAQWRGALADAGTWGALAESPALRDRRVPCTR